MKTQLTSQQELYCQQVASGKTQTEAYKIAYPKSQKWKEKGVWEKASVLSANVKVSARITELQKKASDKTEVTIVYVLEKLAELLNFNLKSIFNEDGTMKQIHELTDAQAACIQDFQVEEIWGGKGEERGQIGVLKKVKIVDKLATIDKYMRKFGQYIENHNHKFDQEDLSHIADILNSIK
jgi:phage terminase small subunit